MVTLKIHPRDYSLSNLDYIGSKLSESFSSIDDYIICSDEPISKLNYHTEPLNPKNSDFSAITDPFKTICDGKIIDIRNYLDDLSFSKSCDAKYSKDPNYIHLILTSLPVFNMDTKNRRLGSSMDDKPICIIYTNSSIQRRDNNINLINQDILDVSKHEFGHHFGLDHHLEDIVLGRNQYCLMNKSKNPNGIYMFCPECQSKLLNENK